MTTAEELVPPTVREVITRMRVLDAALPPGDGVAVFNQLYLSVTETIGRRLAQGYFRHPDSATRLATLFAHRYLDAVARDTSGDRAPACWRPLFRARHQPGVRPLQFALSGINAHIGHDLALAVVDTCQQLGCAPDALETDFLRVGDLLAELEERVRETLMPGPDLLERVDPLTHLVGAWSMDKARDAAWCASRALWAVRELPDLAEEFTQRLDAGIGLVGRYLLTPLDH